MIRRFDKRDIVHIPGVDHPESLSVGPAGEVYTTGTGGQVYRVDLENNRVEQFASTPERCLGQAVDADGNLYCAHVSSGGNVLRITPSGQISVYATGPGGRRFNTPNYPAFDRSGRMCLSESGNWSEPFNGHIHRIKPGGGQAELWYAEPLKTPNAIALDAAEEYLYFPETFAEGVGRIAINPDGSAGMYERIIDMPDTIPDGIAFDSEQRLWIACHRPDAIYVWDSRSGRLSLFCSDWQGHALRGPTDIAFGGPDRDIMLAASLDNLVIHRFGNVGVSGLRLNHPRLPSR